MTRVLIPLMVGLAVSALLTPVTMWIARRNGVVARPAKDRWSRREVPVLGGAAIYVGFLLAVLLAGPVGRETLAILLGATLLFGLGLVDDVRRLRPATKLLGQVVAASLLVALGVKARFVDSAFLTIPVTIIWVVGVTNAFNLIDNMDGLCAGVGAIAAGALGAYALRFDIPAFQQVAVVSLALAGAQIGFLFFNVNPARSFMGDSGALLIGFVLSSTAILGTYEHAGSLGIILAVPVFVMGVPIFDTAFVTIVRKFHRRKVTQGGRDHLSHRLVALGMTERGAVLVLWGICAALAGLGLAASFLDLFANLFLMGVAVIAVIILAIVLGEIAIYRRTDEAEEAAAGEEIRKTFLNYVRGTSVVLLDIVLICLAYLAAYLVKFEGKVEALQRDEFLESLPVVIIAQSIFFHVFMLYRGFWRYFGVSDLLPILKAVAAGSVATVLAIVLLFRFEGYSRALFVVDAMALFLLVAGSRFLFRALLETRRFPPDGRKVLVVGAGDRGELCLRALRTREGNGFLPVGILDPDRALRGRKIMGVPVLGTPDDLEPAVTRSGAREVVLAGSLGEGEVGRLRERCESLDLPLYLAPVSREFVRI
jgi:UDP-GlcNAc:undecaprenyl-phosphate GlcNAc-1-phosphate transferase